MKDAAAYALNRNINFDDLHAPLEEENIKVRAGWEGPVSGDGGCPAAYMSRKELKLLLRCSAALVPQLRTTLLA